MPGCKWLTARKATNAGGSSFVLRGDASARLIASTSAAALSVQAQRMRWEVNSTAASVAWLF